MKEPKVTVYRDVDPSDPGGDSTVTRTDMGGGAVLEEYDYDYPRDDDSVDSSTDPDAGSSEEDPSSSDDDDGDSSVLDDNS